MGGTMVSAAWARAPDVTLSRASCNGRKQGCGFGAALAEDAVAGAGDASTSTPRSAARLAPTALA